MSVDTPGDSVTLTLAEQGVEIQNFISYTANSHFTTPSDGFDFVVAANSISTSTRDALRRGERVTILCNGRQQADGYIDRVTTQASRGGGNTLRVEGSDRLAQVVRAGIDPRTRFSNAETLHDILVKVFAPFGYTSDSIQQDADANRNILTGQSRGVKVSKKGKPLKSFILHQTKPYPGEGAFAFASRLTQRYGLWIWLNAEGNLLIVAKPTFDQPARYKLSRRLNGDASTTNIIDGTSREDATQQPSCIVATGYSYGGEGDRSNLKVIVVNEIVACNPDGFATDAVSKIIFDNQDASQLPLRTVFPPTALKPHPAAQPIYLHDQESQTIEELQNFARRELALRQRDSLHVSYVVEGHAQNGVVWTVDTIVDVDDDYLDIHEPMWILSRSFYKSRDGGTTTSLECIRPYTMDF